jgi:hypothetical protein
MRLRILRPAPARRRRAGPRQSAGPSLFRAIATTVRIALLLWLAVLAANVALASADRIDVQQAALESRDDGYYLSADFDFELKPRVADALEHGLTLYFVVEADLTRSRWYWFDEKAVDTVLTYRLTYHALTRQYRVSTGNLQLGFASLTEAIGVMTHVRDWKVAERGTLRTGETYDAVVRMRLDTTQLPKPFQINAITNRDWTLESDRKRFAFEPR